MLAGLMSRWTTPCACACSSASSSWSMMRTMSCIWKRSLASQDVLQLAALHELHRDVGRAGVLAEVVDRDDVGMREAAGGLRLAAEARDLIGGVLALELLGADGLDAPRPARSPGRSPRRRRPSRPCRARDGSRTCRAWSHPPCTASLPVSAWCGSPVPDRYDVITCTSRRFPRPTSAPGAAPWCRGRRRPAATTTRPSPTCRSRRLPSSPRCSPARPARWSRRP